MLTANEQTEYDNLLKQRQYDNFIELTADRVFCGTAPVAARFLELQIKKHGLVKRGEKIPVKTLQMALDTIRSIDWKNSKTMIIYK